MESVCGHWWSPVRTEGDHEGFPYYKRFAWRLPQESRHRQGLGNFTAKALGFTRSLVAIVYQAKACVFL